MRTAGSDTLRRTLAYRLLASAVKAGPGQEWTVDDGDDVELLPSGSARLAVLQSVAIAARAVQLLAEQVDTTPEAMLRALWPPSLGTTDEQREQPLRVVKGEI